MSDLGRWKDREGGHDPIWIFFSNFGNEQRAHARSSSSAEGMRQLKTLEAVTVFGLSPDDVHDGVNQFSTLGIVAFGPIVAGAALP